MAANKQQGESRIDPKAVASLVMIPGVTEQYVKTWLRIARPLTPLEDVYREILGYVDNSQDHDYGIKVLSILHIARKNDVEFQHKYNPSGSDLEQRRMLFHGTTDDIVPKILEEGFQVPPFKIRKQMFGRAIYFADRASKAAIYCKNPKPLWTVRLMGPMGAELIKCVRMDLISNFVDVLEDAPSKVANYIFHCNVQKPATGETAYHAMMSTFGWAKNPLCHRLSQLDPEIPMTLMYGSRSWVDHYPGEKIQATRPSSYVSYHVVVSGHHIYADTVKSFNEITLAACEIEQKEQDVVK